MTYTVYYVGGPLDGSKWVKPGNRPPRVMEYIPLSPAIPNKSQDATAPYPQSHVKYSLRHLAADLFIAQYRGEDTF